MWIIFLIAAFAGIYGIFLLFNAWYVMQMPLRCSSFFYLDRDAISPEEKAKVRVGEEFLLGEGFVWKRSLCISPLPLDIPGPKEMYLNIYHHAESDVYAILCYQTVLARHCIGYLSCFPDGTYWQTVNRFRHHSPEFDNPCCFDDYLPDDKAAWRAHLKRLSGRQPARDDNLALKIIQEEDAGLVDRLLKRGALKPLGGERWRFTCFFALRWVLAMQMGRYKTRRPASGQMGTTPEKHEIAEVDAFLQQKEVGRLLSPLNKHKGRLFLVTAVLFIAAFTWIFDWLFACSIFFVVLLHEGGHLLAMRGFGYRNTSIFFLPGLGGLAAGEKRNASPYQRLIVYLAGPVPGILLGTGIVIWAAIYGFNLPENDWLFTMTIALLSINYLNLLPVFPLDGGRVIEMLLFPRRPRSRFLFTLTGCLGFLLAAFFLHDMIPMIIGLLLAVGIPTQWRLARVRLIMGKHGKEAQTEEEAAKMVFEVLARPQFARCTLNQRFALANVLITECMERPPRLREVMVGGFIYLLCLCALPLLCTQLP